MAGALSLNISDPRFTRSLSDDEVAQFSAPLFLTGALTCLEVVFWAPAWSTWISLVRDRTGRQLPPNVREVAAAELDYYEQQLLGVR